MGTLSQLGTLLKRRTVLFKRKDASSPQVHYHDVIASYRELEGTALAQFGLSMREHEVACQLIHGATYREAGHALSITESTVRFHAQNVFRKANVRDRRAFERRVHTWLNQWADDKILPDA